MYIHIVVRYKFELDLIWLSSLKQGINKLFGMTIIRSRWYSVAAVSTLVNIKKNVDLFKM